MEEWAAALENKFNILSQNMKEMKVNINNVKYNNFTFNKMKGDLNTPDNPFINTQNKKYKKSNINSNDNLFSLNNMIYTCKKKIMKFILPFSWTDSSCQDTVRYNKLKEIFIPDLICLIKYGKYSYIIRYLNIVGK